MAKQLLITSRKRITDADIIAGVSGNVSSASGGGIVQNLQSVLSIGNQTSLAIIFENDTSQQWSISTDTNGHLIMNGPINSNLHVSGDVVAYSSLTPPNTSWWDDMPIASTIAPVGGVIIGTGLSITAAGVLSVTSTGVSTWLSLSDTPASFVADKWVGVNAIGDALEFKNAPSTGVSTWLSLSDTPASFVADKWVGVNAVGDALEFKSAPLIIETDTLDSVTSRGSTTSNDLSIGTLNIASTKVINHNNDNSYDKIRLWGSGSRSIGFNTGLTHGWVTSNAMTFTGAASDGYVWRKDGSLTSEGVMSLSSGGGLMLSGWIGFGSDATANLGKVNEMLRWNNSSGFIEIGGSTVDTTYAYIQTNKSRFHLNKSTNITTSLTFDKNLTNTLSSVSNALRWTSGGTYYFEVISSSSVCSMRTASISFDMNKKLTVSGSITSTGEITAFSDRAMKSNIRDLEDSTSKVMQLKAKRFIKDNKQQIGLIAQDVESVYPEFVLKHVQGLSLNYQQMTAVLLETIQQQQRRIEKIEQTLDGFRNDKH